MDIKEIAVIVGAVISLLALVKGVFEYARQGTQRRAEYFLKMRDRIFGDDDFNMVQFAIDDGSEEKISEISLAQKETFLSFIEEVAVLKNSKIINVDIAYYMFGYFAISCWNSDYFWSDIDRNDRYWTVFKKFAEQMIEYKQKNIMTPERVKL